jgi:hypothetical protein
MYIFLLFCYCSPRGMAADQPTMYVCPCNCYRVLNFATCSSYNSYEYFISHDKFLISVFQTQKKIYCCVHAFDNTCYSICKIKPLPSLARRRAQITSIGGHEFNWRNSASYALTPRDPNRVPERHLTWSGDPPSL